MEFRNSYEGIDTYAVCLVRRKAARLARMAEFSDLEREDLEQELVMELLQRLRSHDPLKCERGKFIARVVRDKAYRLIRHARAAKRSTCLHRVPMCEALSVPAGRQEDALRMDVAETVAGLPHDLRDLCDDLTQDRVTEIARAREVSRITLYRRIRHIRSRFRAEGLFTCARGDTDSKRLAEVDGWRPGHAE